MRRQAGMVLEWVIANLLTPRVFGYSDYYWSSSEPCSPFECRENIMWLGHLLHCATLYEAMTNDDRYRRPKGLRLVDGNGKEWTTDVVELAMHVATCMRINATGGVPCGE